jgi:hypothetical protein
MRQNPDYGTRPIHLAPVDPTDPTSLPAGACDFHFADVLKECGVYYQHKIHLFHRVHLLGGARFDW